MLARPTAGKVSSPFGWRMLGATPDKHSGIDFSARVGTPVYAADAGTVVNVWPNGAMSKYGMAIVVKHDTSNPAPYSLYAHLSAANVAKGQHVSKGQRIASTGITAASTADANRVVPPHLHFELLSKWPPSGTDQDRVDPTAFLGMAPSPATTGIGLGAVAALLGVLWYLRRKGKRR